jgi:hypothetical protein
VGFEAGRRAFLDTIMVWIIYTVKAASASDY